RFLGQVADALVFLDIRGRLAEDERLALGGKEQAKKELDGGGLAGTVGAEQAEDLAAIDLHIQGAECDFLLPAPEIAIDLRQAPSFDNHFWHGMHLPTSGFRDAASRARRLKTGILCLYAGPVQVVRRPFENLRDGMDLTQAEGGLQ